MAYPNINPMFIITFCAVVLVSCDGGMNESSDSSVPALPLENATTDDTASIQPLDQVELDILSEIKQRSAKDGARYQFDQLIPLFEKNGDKVNVRFDYADTNVVGGSPIVEYSLSQSEIVSIVYTQ